MAIGRKATNRSSVWVGFDLGGTKMLACVFDEGMKVLGRKRRRTKGQGGAAAGLRRVADTIQEALDDSGLDRRHLKGIGVAVPGPVDMDRGFVPHMPNLRWRNARVREVLGKHFGIPVSVLNDVDAGTFGEYRFGAGRGARCLLGVFPGTGIGGACIWQGRILRGATLSGLEVGHMAVLPNGPRCGCGRRGCLEAVASRLAIAGAAAAAAYRGEAPRLLALAGTDLAAIRSGVLAQSIREGDEAVEVIVRQAARWLGRGVANLVNLLVPDVIVLGGGLVEELPELYVREVTEVARRDAMPAYRKSFRVCSAALGDDAGAMGAAAWARAVATGEVS